jgi:hypothetical protein
MVKGNFFGQMVEYMKENGLMVNKMEEENIF